MTIKSLLGRSYHLVSSKGHIKDLPKASLGVDVDNNFEPRYIRIKGKAKIINEIKSACKGAGVVYIASDPDREGEAIAQHLAEEIGGNGSRVLRALFHEITADYIKQALKSPGNINVNLVEAHKARRVLDRIVGYYTSPFLWKTIKGGLSAGRVQSVALRLIVEREKEIGEFKPVTYWNANGEFMTARNERFAGTLHRIDGAYRKIASAEELERVKEKLVQGIECTVTSFRTTNPLRSPAPPFITSTLQQEASRRFNMPPRRTMQIAQHLYEGVKLPQGRTGLITYMRTDSVRVNAKSVSELRGHIAGTFGKEYLNKEIRHFKDRKGAQAGHEAIRPTRIAITPDSIKEHLEPDQYKVYKLIYDRFLASQMAPARYTMKEAIVEHGGIEFKAEEVKPAFLGFQLVAGEVTERGFVPQLSVGDKVRLETIEFVEKQTDPPARYTEASLIKKLEENGIGRPSTYAHIIQTLYDRKYVVRETGKIAPSELGTEVYNIIMPQLNSIFDVSFTARMETELDQIEEGKKAWRDVVREFYDPFVKALNSAKENTDEIKARMTTKTDRVCPKCGKPMIIRWGRYGKFVACTGFPDCKYSENLARESTNKSCPKCGRELVMKHGRFGEFFACSGYPECRYTENRRHEIPCPMCQGEVVVFSSRRGKTYRCKNCGFNSYYPPVAEKCPTCGKGLVQKGAKQVCPACDLKKHAGGHKS